MQQLAKQQVSQEAIYTSLLSDSLAKQQVSQEAIYIPLTSSSTFPFALLDSGASTLLLPPLK
jgi:hypothetical protein